MTKTPHVCCYCGKPARRFAVIAKKHPITGALVAHIGCGPLRRSLHNLKLWVN